MFSRCNLYIFLCLIYFSNALYEDQAGKFDWKQSFVGRVTFSKIEGNGKRVFVATENNVVAAISLIDGSLLWRQVLESDDFGKIHAFSLGNEVVTVSGNGPYLLRGWDLKSGVLTFEWSLPTVGQSDILWTLDSNKVHQVRFLKDSLEVTSYHIKFGNPAGTTQVIRGSWLTSSKCLIDDGVVICVSSDFKVTAFTLASSSLQNFTLLTRPASQFSLNPITSDYTSALLTSTDGQQIVIVIVNGELVANQVPASTTFAIRKSQTEPVLISADNEAGDYYIRGLGLTSKKTLKQANALSYNQKLSEGLISSITCLSENFDLDCQLLIVGQDDSLILIEGDNVPWVREEALANIITVEMIDLPVSDEEAAIEKEFANKEGGILGMFYRRVHSQCQQLFKFATSILGLKESKGASQTLVKDPFGLHKLLILVTKASKVYGMENEKGNIVWQFHLNYLEPFQILGESSVPFYIQRTNRHLPHPAICTIILKQKKSGFSALYAFNPINGQPLYGGLIKLDYQIKQTMQLQKENNEFINGLILLSDANQVYHFPESTKEIALELYKSLYLFTVDSESGLLEGYTFLSSNQKDLQVLQVWNVHLSPSIIGVAIKNKAERVHSQGRVLGDRSVLYKYINPHLIAVATHTTDPVHKNLISVFLIDAVSGGVVFSVVHKRATPPVHIVHSENWIVYSFFNDKSRRTEVISLDLYEGKSQRNSTDFTSLSAPVEPLIERQAYIFPHNVMAMRETITEKGITNKHVLVGVSTGSVIEVPWALLDPHRSPDGREEGVLPYTPDLSLPPEAILTYNHTLPLISGIHTSPSGLESTSLVFIYGLDLFYMRVAPSKTFDVLKDDFEYWLITLVLGGLISAAYISKRLASRKALRQAWK